MPACRGDRWRRGCPQLSAWCELAYTRMDTARWTTLAEPVPTLRLPRAARLLRPYPVRPHHLVVLVFALGAGEGDVAVLVGADADRPRVFLVQGHLPGCRRSREQRGRWQDELVGRRAGVARGRAHDAELHHLAGRSRVRWLEVDARNA